ncbi:unnamed protein product [Phytomonas sp. Hart1]|nr:unnamed protein product [Phytomonas sp. Hart1]|eukprot:CCW70980.1 unnamed protein product [Phytomonas sp. isolate Hart1]
MSNNRKIQVDIYRLLKKTAEGLEFYEELFDKFENAPNLTIKERLEGELKKEIKKLQRQREQIKAFIASSDVKDTKQLEMFRRKIEAKMETFKICEREMKTKTFSKEGLALAANDWTEAPLAQTEAWLKNAIEEGRKKVEIMEYEFQKQQGGLTKSGRRAPSKTGAKSELQIRLEKLNVHIFKWESLLRMVSNEEASLEEVDALRDNAEKVLEEDADLECISNMAMYGNFDIPDPKPKPVTEDPAEEKTDEERKEAPLRSKSRSAPEPAAGKAAGSASTTPKLAMATSPLPNPGLEREKAKKAPSGGPPGGRARRRRTTSTRPGWTS